MNVTPAALKRARSLRWGFPALFLIAGFMIARGAYEFGRDHLQLSQGLVLMTVGSALYGNFRWARWLAAGACFLILVLACAYPMLVFTWNPLAALERPAQMYLFYGIFVFVIGALAFKYLSYLRSAMGRRQFSVSDDEGSAGVLVSAMTWATAIFLIAAIKSDAGASPAPSPSGQPPRTEKFAELQVTGLCRASDMLVMARVENRGNAGGGENFLTVYADTSPGGGNGGTWARVPGPGQTTLVPLENAMPYLEERAPRHVVITQIDAEGGVRESNEANNSREFALAFDDHRLTNLPDCRPPQPILNLESQ